MIIGIKEKGKVVLAVSTFDGFSPVHIGDMVLPENAGLWKVKGSQNTIMGCVFPTAESDAYRYEEALFQGEITGERLIDEIVPAMEEFARDKEYIGNDKGRFEEFLIAQRDKLFRITAEHIVVEIDGFAAISGMSEDIAKGVLYATEGEDGTARIRKVFEFAARERQCDPYPIAVMDTAAAELIILTKEQNGTF